MIINTKHFNTITIDPKEILTFDEGIPGFPKDHRFVLLGEEEDSPFCYLQSIDNAELAFVLVNPLDLEPTYEPKVPQEQLEGLGELKDGSLLVYAIVVVPEDVTQMTANLKAPVVIHVHTKKGKQMITENDEYPIRYKIFDVLQGRQEQLEKEQGSQKEEKGGQ